MAERTRAELVSDATTFIPDNEIREITPATVRQRLIDHADSLALRSELSDVETNLTQSLGEAIAAAVTGIATIPYAAQVDIPAFTVVVQVSGLLCAPANPANAAHCGKVIGFVKTAVTAGSNLTVITSGPVSGITGTFAANKALFIAADGTLTDVQPVYPAAAWLQQVGRSSTTSDVVFEIGEALILEAFPIALPAGASLTTIIQAFTGATPSGYGLPVRIGQLRRALRQSGYPASSEGLGIPADDSDVAIAWADGFVPSTGILASHIQSTASINLTSGEWATVYALAATLSN